MLLGLWRLGEETRRLHVILQLVLRLQLNLVESAASGLIIALSVHLQYLDLAKRLTQTWHVVEARLRVLAGVHHAVEFFGLVSTTLIA